MELKFKSDHDFTSLCIQCYLISLKKWFSNCSDTSSDKWFLYLWRFLFTDFLTLIYWGSEMNFIESSVAYKTWETLNMTYADFSIVVLFYWLLLPRHHQTAYSLSKLFFKISISSSLLLFSLEHCYSPPPTWFSKCLCLAHAHSLTQPNPYLL